jgi:hypothetical protein
MSRSTLVRRVLPPLAGLALLALGGCVAYPAYGPGPYAGGYYDGGYGYAYAPPVVVAPVPVVVGGGWGRGWGGGWHR